jgi:putative NADH-flavin reductase
MKIAVIGANGRLGKLLVEEALGRGHEVTAIIRKGEGPNPKAKTLVKDLFHLQYDDIKEQELIIDSFGVWEPEELYLHKTSLQYLSDLISGKSNRLIVIGSAGSLIANAETKVRLLDSPQMPQIYKPLSSAMTEAFDVLRVRTDLNWTYFSPPGFFNAGGPRSGQYQLGTDELLVNKMGESTISYADAAIAVIDEAENGNYNKKRFTVAAL